MQPGRVAASRLAPALFLPRASIRMLLALAGFLALCGACTSPRPPEQRALGTVWLDYEAMPAQRALALAGTLRDNRWVAGAAGGHETSAQAQQEALRVCAIKRQRARMQFPCRLYAIGDKVVWSGD